MTTPSTTALQRLALATLLSVAAGPVLAWGALAIDGNQGDRYGYSYDLPTAKKAERRALKECGPGCEVVLDFETGCAAYAADQTLGSDIYGWGKASTQAAVKDRALAECEARGGDDCTVRVWGCHTP